MDIAHWSNPKTMWLIVHSHWMLQPQQKLTRIPVTTLLSANVNLLGYENRASATINKAHPWTLKKITKLKYICYKQSLAKIQHHWFHTVFQNVKKTNHERKCSWKLKAIVFLFKQIKALKHQLLYDRQS